MLNSKNTRTSSIYTGNIVRTSVATTINVNPIGNYLPSGKYRVNVHVTNVGYCTIKSN